MRKLKLQVQMSIDGFVGGPNGELDWMSFEMDDRLIAYINELTDSSDTIILGRKMTDGFVNYWSSVQPDSPEYSFAQKMNDTPKVVFTKTLETSPWPNTTLASGDLVEEINKLKLQTGKDIIVYGGASFVSSLIENGLIDELNLFINPIAIGTGLTIFGDAVSRTKLKLTGSDAYDSGVVVNHYRLA